MMACSMEPDPHITEAKTSLGLIRGHAYSVTKVLKAKIDTGRKQGLFPLVRIRNPWGEAEWKGAWSDHSDEWIFVLEEEKIEHGIVFENDGEFFMSKEDFLKVFFYYMKIEINIYYGSHLFITCISTTLFRLYNL